MKHFFAAALTTAFFFANSPIASATHSWGGYHWARTTPEFTLKVGDNLLTAQWKQMLQQTAVDWNSMAGDFNSSTPVTVALVAGAAGSKCKAVSGTVQACNGTYGRNRWLGMATIYLSGLHITKGLVRVNDTYFNTSTYNNPNEKLHVMCQELAHTFGLDHQDDTGASLDTCTDYFSNTGDNAGSDASTAPNAHDFEELNLIYLHTDGGSTLAASATSNPARAKSAASPGVDPSTWGALIAQSGNGRSSVYEAFDAQGKRVLTHVYWTAEAVAGCAPCDHRPPGGR